MVWARRAFPAEPGPKPRQTVAQLSGSDPNAIALDAGSPERTLFSIVWASRTKEQEGPGNGHSLGRCHRRWTLMLTRACPQTRFERVGYPGARWDRPVGTVVTTIELGWVYRNHSGTWAAVKLLPEASQEG